jgi:autotransporter-associated beta strand protein
MYDSIQLTRITSSRRSSISQWPWRRHSILCALAPAWVFLLLAAAAAFGDSATWNLNPINSEWEFASNWTPATIPDGPNDIAIFSTSNTTGIVLRYNFEDEVNSIVFDTGASPFTITVNSFSSFDYVLTISGVGIANNSGIAQNFVTKYVFDRPGVIHFTNRATAGDLTIFTNNGGRTEFFNTSRAGSATFNNQSGITSFSDSATADNATFSGVIQEGGIGGGTGGSLSKIGTGTPTLTGANTYTGDTTIEGGRFVVNNMGGSGAGTGAVQVTAGTLGGRGIIGGAVTVGTGSGTGAVLAPGRHGGKPGNPLTIQSALTFNSDATYDFGFSAKRAIADKVVANGVTVSGAQFHFVDRSAIALPSGAVFTAIDNTAATPDCGYLQ